MSVFIVLLAFDIPAPPTPSPAVILRVLLVVAPDDAGSASPKMEIFVPFVLGRRNRANEHLLRTELAKMENYERVAKSYPASIFLASNPRLDL
jgi:hypothetical protein